MGPASSTVPGLLRQGPSSVSPPPTATAKPDALRRWLTDERQELLADTVTTLAKEHGWAAGCVFRYNADEAIVNEFARPAGTAAYSFVNDSELRPAVVVFVEGRTKASGSYREHIPEAVSFCYVPE